ncbi:conserved hypothetical protein [Ricinus communis]|uniref:Uncharacterized protein n=1 Tax=Ricinus communis TaxID=3988 RepID=B9STB3_RICCO|nr:conserved hypothetical protein [Ricinus communis]
MADAVDKGGQLPPHVVTDHKQEKEQRDADGAARCTAAAPSHMPQAREGAAR